MSTSDHGDGGLRKGLTSYGDPDFSLFLRKAFIKGAGYSDEALKRPIVGIANTESAYNACHGNTPQLVEAVKRGVMLAGGLPMEFPIISIHESFASPTSMYLRNLMSIDTEEMIRAQPMDAVVLIGGCDKTVPAQLMGAASAGIPAIQLVTGSMLTGSHQDVRVGACTDCRRYCVRRAPADLGLHCIPDFLVDQWFMDTGKLLALAAHAANVAGFLSISSTWNLVNRLPVSVRNPAAFRLSATVT